MKQQTNRKAIWVSAVLTVLAMGIASLFLFGSTHLFAASQGLQASATALRGAAAQGQSAPSAAATTHADETEVIAAYRAQLDQTYAALQDAYAQIQTLQDALAQSQGQLRRFNGDGRGRQILPQTSLNREEGSHHD